MIEKEKEIIVERENEFSDEQILSKRDNTTCIMRLCSMIVLVPVGEKNATQWVSNEKKNQ